MVDNDSFGAVELSCVTSHVAVHRRIIPASSPGAYAEPTHFPTYRSRLALPVSSVFAQLEPLLPQVSKPIQYVG